MRKGTKLQELGLFCNLKQSEIETADYDTASMKFEIMIKFFFNSACGLYIRIRVSNPGYSKYSHLIEFANFNIIASTEPESILRPRVCNQNAIFLNPIIRTEVLWVHEHKNSKDEK